MIFIIKNDSAVNSYSKNVLQHQNMLYEFRIRRYLYIVETQDVLGVTEVSVCIVKEISKIFAQIV